MAKKKSNLDGLRRKARNFLLGAFDKKRLFAQLVIDNMKTTISRGQSPVRNVGRYQAYKAPKKYPAKMKKQSPVNLSLTGKMLKALTYKIERNIFKFGIFDDTEAKKMAGIEAGTVANPPIPRPTIPRRQGEEFTPKIMRDLMRSLKELFKKTK